MRLRDGGFGDRVSPERVAIALASVKLAIHALTLRPYGFFRDELYYIACSDHLAFGYVDHPPLSIVLLKAWRIVFGDSLAALRILPALVGAAVVLVTGLLAIRLGGGALAVGLAGLGVIVSGRFLNTAHYFSMNVLDELFWVLGAYVALRAVTERAPRVWVALGAILGMGLLNKISVLWFGAGLALGLVATPARRALRTRWPYLAGALALALFAPYVAWEARHGWPTVEFMQNAMAHKYVPRSLPKLLRTVIEQMDPFTLPVWALGLVALVARRLGDRAAVLGWIFAGAFAIVASQRAAKAEYISPAFPMVMAAGGVAWERLLAGAKSAWIRPFVAGTLAVGMLVGGALSAPFALAVLSEPTFVAYERALGKRPESTERREVNELGQFYADMHGWPELAAAVADVFDALASDERRGATIWVRSGGYGPAAAIDFFGRARGLPPAISGHNNYWLWGPGSGDGNAVIVVGGKATSLAPLFESFEQVTIFECTWCRPDENHKPIYVGRRLKRPLAELWPNERYFD